MRNAGFLCLLSILAIPAHSAGVTQINRYATVENKPLAAQVHPLMAVQQMHFPPEVKTVGDAMAWWLQYSGFSLATAEHQPAVFQQVLSHVLPQVDRNLGPLTVKEGLEVLAGQHVFTLREDPVLRVITFKLNPAFTSLTPSRSK